MRLERLNNLPLNTVTPNFVAIFVFFGTASSFTEIISSSETKANREAILFLFGCSEVNSTRLITSELAYQRARKVLFTCVVYTNYYYFMVIQRYFFTQRNPRGHDCHFVLFHHTEVQKAIPFCRSLKN